MFHKVWKISLVIFVLCCASISLLSIGSENSCESLNVQKNWEKSVLCNPPPAPNPPTGEVQVGYVGCTYEFCTTMPDYGPYQVRFDWGDGKPYSPWVNADSANPLLFCSSHAWYHNHSNLIGFYVSAQARDYTTGELSEWSWRSTRIAIHPNRPPNTPEKPSGETYGIAGQEYTYETQTTDPEEDKISYQFYWGDGTTSGWEGPYLSGKTGSAIKTWNHPGTYRVKVKAREADKCFRESDWSPSLTVTIKGNNPPNKPEKPSGPTSGETGKIYMYSSKTTDIDGDQIYYQFDWGDGTQGQWIGPYPSEQTATDQHEWSTRGPFNIKVKAKDATGFESEWSDFLAVTMRKKSQPIITSAYLNNFFLKECGLMDCTLKIIEPNGGEIWSGEELIRTETRCDTSQYTKVAYTFWYSQCFPADYHIIVKDYKSGHYVWDTRTVPNGEYTLYVSLWADTNSDGQCYGDLKLCGDNSDNCFTILNNHPPKIPSKPSGPLNGIPGESYSYSTSTTDQDDDRVQYGWDWDGDLIVDDWTEFYDSGETCAFPHIWYVKGEYVIRVKARDIKNEESDWSSPIQVIISFNREPNKPTKPTGAMIGKAGKGYIYSTVATDPDGDKLYYLWDWGDETKNEWDGPYNSGKTCEVTHTWDQQGSFSIKVKAKDEHGGESDWSDPLSVAMPKNKVITMNTLFQQFLELLQKIFPQLIFP